ncbi:MAG: DUF1501 domain-containing protein [Actinomycetota bacterium]
MFVGCSSRSRGSRRPTRREMLVRFGEAGFGLSLPLLLQSAPATASGGFGKARSCILLFLSGGASQYETFDLKPDGPLDYRGTFKPIRTNVAGIDICEHLPLLARQAHRYSVIRSMSHTEGSHPAGCYWMITGRKYPRGAAKAAAMSRDDHPHYGSVLTAVRPVESGAVPTFVTLPEQINPNGPIRAGQHAGFLGSAYDPMVVNADPNAPDFTAGELTIQEGLTEGRVLRRRALLSQANLRARIEEEEGAQADLQPHYARAFDLLTGGRAAHAFNVGQETAATRERYGRHIFGQSVLAARRLVESGVRLVAVNWVRHDDGAGGQGWDSHSKHLEWSKDELLPPTDRAASALLTDLADRGLLDETLVIMTGEFGRTPKFNAGGGRDHWPNVFSVLAAGGGIRGGQVYGASTPDGAYPAVDKCTPADLAATLYHCLGVSPTAEIYDRTNRPFPVAEGEVLRTLL